LPNGSLASQLANAPGGFQTIHARHLHVHQQLS
jgi:hypothetical protein